MPWCEGCSKFWDAPRMAEGGACPTCGAVIAPPRRAAVPWHFKVMLVGLAGYLIYRIWWLAEWIPKHW